MNITTAAWCHDGEGSVFLMKRSPNCRDEHNTWDLCAGNLEDGWAAEQNMLREITEELGVTPLSLRFLGYRDVFRVDLPQRVALDFTAVIPRIGTRIMETDKFTDSGWFREGDLPSPLHSQMPLIISQHGLSLWGE
jgi:ADP-ribose pyrophosphatase YjhB (NUDIX family)